MTIKENLLQRIHENEDCPICMGIIKIEEIVYIEPCNHVYCIWCLEKWCMAKRICPIDTLKLENVYVYNPVEAEIKVVEIKHVLCQFICRDSHNKFKVMTAEFIYAF